MPAKTKKAKGKKKVKTQGKRKVKTPKKKNFAGVVPYTQKKTEKYMSSKMCRHFREILLTWRNYLMAEADRTVNQMRNGSVSLPDLNDRATQEEEFNLELRTRDRERKLIKKINGSLKALDKGEYGYCESCGEQIGLRRLEARPTANLCIDCKTLDEIREKQEGS